MWFVFTCKCAGNMNTQHHKPQTLAHLIGIIYLIFEEDDRIIIMGHSNSLLLIITYKVRCSGATNFLQTWSSSVLSSLVPTSPATLLNWSRPFRPECLLCPLLKNMFYLWLSSLSSLCQNGVLCPEWVPSLLYCGTLFSFFPSTLLSYKGLICLLEYAPSFLWKYKLEEGRKAILPILLKTIISLGSALVLGT